jgi:microcystin-dependent protein
MQTPFIGEVALFAFTFAPQGWVPCAGQLFPIAQNTALFSLLGTAFGGDGKTTFALPNYSSLAPQGMQYCMALQGIFPQVPSGPPVVGGTAMLPYSFTPPGWVNCKGQLLSIAQYEGLFQVLGTRFGGDGEMTFGVPNLKTTPPPSAYADEGDSLYNISLFGVMGPPDAMIATVQLLPFTTAPNGWAACAGQLLSVPQNQGLFTLLGFRFGGNGQTLFALPDLRSVPVPAGMQYYICVGGHYPSPPPQ